MTSPLRIAVFFDWQNCYRSAQDALGPGTNGNVNPFKLAQYLARSRPPGSAEAQLSAVEIYSGIPSQRRDPASYAARRRQHAAWQGLSPLVRMHTRTLAYRSDSQGGVRGQEKGIDVAIAIDLVRHVVFERTCDIAVLVSADTDLLPALELIVEQRGVGAIEVATWDGGHAPGALRVEGHLVHQHHLTEKLYHRFKDLRDYSQRRS